MAKPRLSRDARQLKRAYYRAIAETREEIVRANLAQPKPSNNGYGSVSSSYLSNRMAHAMYRGQKVKGYSTKKDSRQSGDFAAEHDRHHGLTKEQNAEFNRKQLARVRELLAKS